LARSHNNVNIIALSSTMPLFKMKDIIDVFLKTPFSNEERHQRRIDKINNYGNVNEYIGDNNNEY
ncbi:MAG: hypothetical protein GX247_05590, partial [Mollicutes bacterium]|nr:hypothetical protein [Mollicutes bacterium]